MLLRADQIRMKLATIQFAEFHLPVLYKWYYIKIYKIIIIPETWSHPKTITQINSEKNVWI
jgi:hypothetical protein